MLDGAANHRLCQLPLGVLARWVEFEVPFVNHEPIVCACWLACRRKCVAFCFGLGRYGVMLARACTTLVLPVVLFSYSNVKKRARKASAPEDWRAVFGPRDCARQSGQKGRDIGMPAGSTCEQPSRSSSRLLERR